MASRSVLAPSRLVKEYFGLAVLETIKTWSLMETAISVRRLLLAPGSILTLWSSLVP